jgi:antitoxin component YwqK of YwqJK toxin-antitoxin module
MSNTGIVNDKLEYIEYYEKGHLREIIYYINKQIYKICKYDYGMKEGEYKEYHENGQLYKIFYYINDKEEGEFKSYYENG